MELYGHVSLHELLHLVLIQLGEHLGGDDESDTAGHWLRWWWWIHLLEWNCSRWEIWSTIFGQRTAVFKEGNFKLALCLVALDIHQDVVLIIFKCVTRDHNSI